MGQTAPYIRSMAWKTLQYCRYKELRVKCLVYPQGHCKLENQLADSIIKLIALNAGGEVLLLLRKEGVQPFLLFSCHDRAVEEDRKGVVWISYCRKSSWVLYYC